MTNREIDKLIAEHVFDMNATWGRDLPPGDPAMSNDDLFHTPDGVNGSWSMVRNYSTDIAAAWLVVDKMPYSCDIIMGVSTCVVSFYKLITMERYCADGISNQEVPMAISRAALKAKGVKIDG